MNRPVISNIPTKVLAPILLTVPVLISVVVLSSVAFFHGRSAVRHLASENLAEIQDRIHTQVGKLLDSPARLNQINENLIRQGKLDLNNIRQWRQTLVAQAKAFERISAIVWGSETGQAVWIARYSNSDHLTFAVKDDQSGDVMDEYHLFPSGDIDNSRTSSFKFDPRVRPWYVTPMKADKPAWSEPFVWIGENNSNLPTVGIAYGQPYRDKTGKIIGIVDSDLSLHDISRFLESLKIGKTGLAFVVDRQGLLIANSISSAVTTPDLKRLHASQSGDSRIGSAAKWIIQEHGTFGTVASAYEKRLVLGGTPYLAKVSPFDHSTGLRWLTVTLVPESDFMATIEQGRRRSIIVGALAVGATLLLGVAIAMWMIRPFLTLVSQLRQIGAGDLEHEVHLEHTPEFRQLSDEINKMSADLRDRLKLRQSLAVAMQVQQTLLPSNSPNVKGLDISGHSTYCEETGGDYYDYLDVIDLSDTTVAVAVGDVMGHGVAAAMLMATARGILVSHCDETGSLSELLTHLNDHLVKDAGEHADRFMTMLLMTIDSNAGQVRWASAGHESPFVYSKATNSFIDLGLGDIPLGIFGDHIFKEHSFNDVHPGQIYLAGTDGIWETANPDGEMFGKDRLRTLLQENADLPAEQINNAIRQALIEFRADASQYDDITFVVIKVK